MMSDEATLLREYADANSERAFSTLVSRHIDLVYSVSMRQVRDAHLAQEVTQNVFILLARKAKSLGPDVILAGWLCRAARYLSADALKIQRRRQIREQESQMQSTLNETDANAWDQIVPWLDQAMSSLGKKEHDVIVLRFFKEMELGQVGAAMGIGEDAARMRVNRAVEKLRNFFSRKGVAISTVAIAGALSANSLQAAPVGLAAAITASAFSGAASSGAAMLTVTKLITMTTLQKTVIVVTAVALTGVVIHQNVQMSRLQNRLAAAEAANGQSASLQHERDELSAEVATLRQQGTLNQSNLNEVVRLRGELARLRTANVRPPENNTVARVPEKGPATKQEIPKSSWVDAGFGTPEAALKTRGWSVLNGDRERFKQSLYVTDGARKQMEDMLVQMAQQSNDPNKDEMIKMVLEQKLGVEEGILMPMMAENQQKGYTGYQIVSDQPLSSDEHMLQVKTQLSDGSAREERLKLRQFAGDWKVVIDEEFLKSPH